MPYPVLNTTAHADRHPHMHNAEVDIVGHFNADPTGALDSTNAIQNALDSGRPVFIPDGAFKIAPTGGAGSYILEYPSDISVRGSGPGSILKVADDAGDYLSVFGPAVGASDHVTFRDFTVDQNPGDNTTADILTATMGTHQNVIRADSTSQMTVDGMWFDPCDGVNTVVGGGTAKDITVRNCYFRFAPGSSTDTGQPYDNSAIYLEVERHSVTDCIFVADTADGARAAIESHGGHSTISGNVTDGYETLVNVVTKTDLPDFEASNINVVGNSILNCALGVQLWPGTGRLLANVTIVGNDIFVNQIDRATEGRETFTYQGIGAPFGGNIQGSMENVTIAGNNIRFQVGDRSYPPDLEGQTGGIIVAWPADTRGLNIVGNTIVDSPRYSIWVAGGNPDGFFQHWYRGLNIVGNTSVDAGRDVNAPLPLYRGHVAVTGQVQSLNMAQNIILDTGDPDPNGAFSYYLAPLPPDSADVKWRDNTVTGDLQRFASGPVTFDDDPDTALQVILADGRGGLGAVANLALRSEQFDDAAWLKENEVGHSVPTITANATTGPYGASTADSFVAHDDGPAFAGYLRQQVAVSGALAGRSFTASVYVKGAGASIGTRQVLRIENDAGADNTDGNDNDTQVLTGGWQRLVHSYTFAAGTSGSQIDLIIGNTDLSDGNNVYLWGAQLTETAGAAIYAATTSTPIADQTALLLNADKVLAGGGLGIGNSAAATTPGSVTRKLEVFDAAGASLGYVPIYDAIT